MSKETKYLGRKELLFKDTGEVLDCDVLIRPHREMKKGWNRVYLGAFMDLLIDISTSKAIKVVEFILDNLNSDHQFFYSIEHTAKKCNIAYSTCQNAFKQLKKANFLRSEGKVYIVNPEFIGSFGSDSKNKAILVRFNEAEPTLFDAENQKKIKELNEKYANQEQDQD